MMKLQTSTFALLFVLASISGKAQKNLVFNPSFETGDLIYTKLHTLNSCKLENCTQCDRGDEKPINEYNDKYSAGNRLVDGWEQTSAASTDYYNSPASTMRGHPLVKARSGKGRMALILGEKHWSSSDVDYREYITGILRKPLEAGKKYLVTFYVTRYKYAHFAPLEVAACLTKDPLTDKYNRSKLKAIPQIGMDLDPQLGSRFYWTKIEGVYTALGGERYITIGNFLPKPNPETTESPIKKQSNKFTIVSTRATAYYFLDDVSVVELEENTVPRTKELLVFLMDVSRSMEYKNRLKETREAVLETYKDLPEHIDIAVIGFSSRPEIILSPSRPNPAALKGKLDSLKTESSTNANKSLRFCYEQTEAWSAYTSHIVLCTDGSFSLDNDVKEMIRRHSDKALLHVIQFNDKVNAELEALQNETGGAYLYSGKKSSKAQIREVTQTQLIEKERVQYSKGKPGAIALKWALIAGVGALIAIRLSNI